MNASPAIAAVNPDELYDPISPELQVDPYPTYKRLRDEHPVYHQQSRGFWVLSRYDDVWNSLRDAATFSSSKGVTFDPNEAELVKLMPMMITTDPPEHTRLRNIVNKGFTRRRVQDLEDSIRDFVINKIDGIVEAGGGDLKTELASELPAHVLAEFLGVPQDDRGNFAKWNHDIVRAMSDNAINLNQGYATLMELYAYFSGLVFERRKEPGDDLISKMLTAEVDGEKLTDADVLGFCFLMVTGGSETMTNVIDNGALLLYEHPDQRQELIDDPSLIPNAYNEILRMEAPVQGLSRTTTCDVEVRGVIIPADSKVHMLFASANRDERTWGDDADQFDIHRDHSVGHLSFSQGPHYCMGAFLARVQGRVVFEELLARMPGYEIDTTNLTRIPSAFVRGWDELPISVG